MTVELPKAYIPKTYEDAMYKRWEESGFFNPDNLEGEPYAIMMPPPNVTGILHLGHALENSLMDTMARYQRMRGKKVLLVPGTDHAAVATQAKVEKLLVQDGIKNPREHFGREALLQKIREYSENSKATILSQVRKLGTSADWSRLAYTFDEDRSRAVNEVFVRMYNDGLIYRGHRVVNWSVKGQSTCSDDELVHVERPGKLYYFKYSKDFPITIATTRPETKLGDTAVAVHPNDERYNKFIGQTFTVDVGATNPLAIRIIADEGIDPNFGTGALGVTPAHSPTDYEMYVKQKALGNDIGSVQVIGIDGRMTAEAGKDYKGLTVLEAREKFVEHLRSEGLLEKEEDTVQNVGTSDRFGDIVEPLPLTQWFIDVNKIIPGRGKSLKDLMREAVTTGHKGDPNQKITITPDRFEKIYLHWIENLRDWCISRQIWWGHRIPVWYRNKLKVKSEKLKDVTDTGRDVEMFVGAEAPVGEGWEQDPDTLDTWFSSGLWTFSTLGWPDKTKDLETFHPTSWMQMGYEIIFFWMARMILMTTYTLDQIPFRDVYIHGMLRDESGKKFSKSSGNNIDPLDVIAEYGTDALRLSALSGISPGNDSKFYEEKIEGSRNLVNKLWNISRFILLQINSPSSDAVFTFYDATTLADRWILDRLERLRQTVTQSLGQFNFSFASEMLREFTWGDLADWYLEVAKTEGDKAVILNHVLNKLLKLWHPFAPFVTEAIWHEVYGSQRLLMIEKWPDTTVGSGVYAKDSFFTKAELEFQALQRIIAGIRALRSENKIEPVKLLKVVVSAGDNTKLVAENAEVIKKLARLESLIIEEKADKPAQAVGFVEGGVEVFIDLGGVVDVDKEKERLTKEIADVEKYVKAQETKLGNHDFIARAPAAVVEGEKKKLEDAREKFVKLQSQLTSLM